MRLVRENIPFFFSFSSLKNLGTVIKADALSIGRLRGRALRRGLVSLVIALSLLMWPGAGPLARNIITDASKAAYLPFARSSYEAFAVESFLKRLVSIFFSKPRVQRKETTESRSAKVRSIELSPAKAVAYLNQRLAFSVVGKDSLGNVVQGTRVNWSSSDATRLKIDDSGQATPLADGLVWVTASTQFALTRAAVLIRPQARTVQTDDEWKADQDQLNPDGTVGTTPRGVGSLLDTLLQRVAPTVHAQTSGGDSGDFLYDELWSEPRNLVGSPRNRATESSRIGAVLPEGSDLEFSVPIVALPGRGLPSGVALNYNSRVWSRHGSAVTFNAVNSWPYVGFNLSFGRIVTYASGSNTKFVLIDGDGTRHYLGSGPGGTTTTYQTNDGSHITYVGTSTGGGTLYFNSGVTMSVSVVNNRLLVTQIKDSNGNFISISYQANRIQLRVTVAEDSSGIRQSPASRTPLAE